MATETPRKFGRELFGLFLLFWSLLLLLSIVTFDINDPSLNHVVSSSAAVTNSAGLFGAYTAGLLNDVFGIGAYIWPALFAALGAAYVSPAYALPWWRWCGAFLLTVVLLVIGSAWGLSLGDISGGGMVGNALHGNTSRYLSPVGSSLVWLFVLLIGLQLCFDISWFAFAALVRDEARLRWKQFRAGELFRSGSGEPAEGEEKTPLTFRERLAAFGRALRELRRKTKREVGESSFLIRLRDRLGNIRPLTDEAMPEVYDDAAAEGVATPDGKNRQDVGRARSAENRVNRLRDVRTGITPETPGEEAPRQPEDTAPAGEAPDADMPPWTVPDQAWERGDAPSTGADAPDAPNMEDVAEAARPPLSFRPPEGAIVPEVFGEDGRPLPPEAQPRRLMDGPDATAAGVSVRTGEDGPPAAPAPAGEFSAAEPPLSASRAADAREGAVSVAGPTAELLADVYEEEAAEPLDITANVPTVPPVTAAPAGAMPAASPVVAAVQEQAAAEPLDITANAPIVPPVTAAPGSTTPAASPVAAAGQAVGEAVKQAAQKTLAGMGRKAPVPLPGLDLLSPPAPDAVRPLEDPERARALMACLRDFDIQAELVRVTPGPVVTMYEVRPAPGVRVNRIANLSGEIALALKAIAVRIQAPIPGQDTVGIEIPNTERQTVNFRELVASEAFRKGCGPLTMVLGKDIAGRPVLADLAKMPHLLVAGATGAGKSVCLNGILLSLLYRTQPSEMQLLLVDPKRIEMAVYADEPHLVHPVVKEMSDAKNALDWAVHEMDSRYDAMARLGVRNIAGYNQKLASYGDALPDDLRDLEPMSYLVIVIDELADLMLTAGREVETSIVRLAQLARASGIHMILATQRPSVNVVTGLIKANFPCRISFQVASVHDSRTILDQAGAEHLLGRGDMLFKPSGGQLQRLHGPFVSDEEVHNVVQYWKRHLSPSYKVDFASWGLEAAGAGPGAGRAGGGGNAANDPVYPAVQAFVTEQGKASISLVQRRFNIGFNRAARIMEQLEQDGIIGPASGSKPRAVVK